MRCILRPARQRMLRRMNHASHAAAQLSLHRVRHPLHRARRRLDSSKSLFQAAARVRQAKLSLEEFDARVVGGVKGSVGLGASCDAREQEVIHKFSFATLLSRRDLGVVSALTERLLEPFDPLTLRQRR